MLSPVVVNSALNRLYDLQEEAIQVWKGTLSEERKTCIQLNNSWISTILKIQEAISRSLHWIQQMRTTIEKHPRHFIASFLSYIPFFRHLVKKNIFNGKWQFFWIPEFIQAWLGHVLYIMTLYSKRKSPKAILANHETQSYQQICANILNNLVQNNAMLAKQNSYKLLVVHGKVDSCYAFPGGNIVVFEGFIDSVFAYYTKNEEMLKKDKIRKQDLLAAAIISETIHSLHPHTTKEFYAYMLFCLLSSCCFCFDTLFLFFQSLCRKHLPLYSHTMIQILDKFLHFFDYLESTLTIIFAYCRDVEEEIRVDITAMYCLQEANYAPKALLYLEDFLEKNQTYFADALYLLFPHVFNTPCPKTRKKITQRILAKLRPIEKKITERKE